MIALLAACGSAAPAATPTSPSTPLPPTQTPLPSATFLASPVPGSLMVDPLQRLGSISPYVYGSNTSPVTMIPFGMMDDALKSGLTAVRFPGGNWGDQNDVSDFQIDLYMGIFKQMGAMPVFMVRLENSRPQAAAQMVQDVNLEKKYGVVYWEIGNEPNLYANLPGVQYDTQRFNQEWRAFALAMKAVDPSIKLIGPDVNQFYADPSANPKDVNGRDWMTEFLKANGDLVDVVTFHKYPFPREQTAPNATVEDLRQNPPEWTQTIQSLRSLIHATTGRDLPIAVTEANSHYNNSVGGQATPDSFYNAIWWADVLGRLINENVFMVNQWDMATPGMSGDGFGLIATAHLRPTYYVYQMYKNFGTQRVYASSGVADVTIYAAEDANGALTLMVVNLSASKQHPQIQIQGTASTRAETWLFDASHNAVDLGQQPLPANGQLVLPAQSISLYILK